MAGKKQAPRQERERRPFSRPMRYDQRTVREEREYGVYWYAWLWRVLRPVTVFFCAVLIVIGIVAAAGVGALVEVGTWVVIDVLLPVGLCSVFVPSAQKANSAIIHDPLAITH